MTDKDQQRAPRRGALDWRKSGGCRESGGKKSKTGLAAFQAASGPDTSPVTSPCCADAALPEIGTRR